ncbi:3-phosphoserine/phosphohydroxythreonine transaminase [Liquorilactobacillus oeni]|uniref:Phosphoserine aminotransferase n=1 Tax=Liquorilactobacillus oeni DSM 19972 TaxID=1423777 RepID=A0A0R1MAK6_9LACO|nr:3-phosphoserine/phosphohydroxythreonine transaminase [Liquorilactobacillus oeni]KRL05271.1 3-phosphoserine phosphohydroxythreonine aminotransferase [Liquorilactobacillus oeni DSM 19972]
MTQVYNFAAGPAVLPAEVLRQVQSELISYKNSGMSIMEISHRSSLYTDMAFQAEADLRKLMNIPAEYDVLFLQGGATLQFALAPLNLANKYHKIAFADTGHWAQRAQEDGQLLSGYTTEVAASSKLSNYTELPSGIELAKNYDYLHLTMNNTIEGTMYKDLPYKGDVPVVGDLSSIILGQEYNVNDFGMIYAGAQKNIGPAGLTIVIVKHTLFEEAPELPAMFSYAKQAAKHSALNTPPVFAIYVAGLVFKWLLQQGGVSQMQRRNEEKAQLLYDYLDSSKLFSTPVTEKKWRSLTNIPFVTGDKAIDKRFIVQAQANNLLNLKGHRLVGGMRASLYNAFPRTGVEKLIEFMQKFEKAVGGTR